MAAVSGKRKRNKINKNNAGYFFIAPYFIVFLTFTLYPILYTFKLSFMSWDGFGEQQFIGLANYQRLLQDQMFIKSIGNTIYCTFSDDSTDGIWFGACVFAESKEITWK